MDEIFEFIVVLDQKQIDEGYVYCIGIERAIDFGYTKLGCDLATEGCYDFTQYGAEGFAIVKNENTGKTIYLFEPKAKHALKRYVESTANKYWLPF